MGARMLASWWRGGALALLALAWTCRAEPAAPPPGPGPTATELLARMPAEIDGAVAVSGLSRVFAARPGQPPVTLAIAGALATYSPQSLAAWAAFSQQLGWTGAEAADRLVGGSAVLLWRRGEGERPAAWAVVTQISADTDRRLRERLRVVPRTIVRGRPVLAVEGGDLLFASGPERDDASGRGVLACLLPREDDGLLDRLAPVLGGEAGRLSQTAAFGPLNAAGQAPIAAVFRLAGPPGEAPWRRYAAAAAWADGTGSGRMQAWIDGGPALSGLSGVGLSPDVLDEAGRPAAVGGEGLGEGDELIAVGREVRAELPRPWVILRPLGVAMGVAVEGRGGEAAAVDPLLAAARAVVLVREGRSVGVGVVSELLGTGAAGGDRAANMLLDAAGRATPPAVGDELFGFDGLLPEAERRESVPIRLWSGEAVGWTAVWRSTDLRAGGRLVAGASRHGDAGARGLAAAAERVQAAAAPAQPVDPAAVRAWISRGVIWPRRAAAAMVWPPPAAVALKAMDVERLVWGVWREGERVRVEVAVERE